MKIKAHIEKFFYQIKKNTKWRFILFNNINSNYFSAKYLSNNNFDFNVCFGHVIGY